MELFGYASLIGVGLLLGMMGGGGSILSVPILVYLFSLDVVVASSYSLFIVGSTSVVGTALKQRERFVDIPAALKLGVPSVSRHILYTQVDRVFDTRRLVHGRSGRRNATSITVIGVCNCSYHFFPNGDP